jgi:alkylhydroperoxidase family enzyme
MSKDSAFIQTIPPDSAQGLLARLYKSATTRAGKVYKVLEISSLNPGVLKAWVQLYQAVMFAESPLTRSEREMIAVSVSWANRCHY